MKKAMIVLISFAVIAIAAIAIYKMTAEKHDYVYEEYYKDFQERKEMVISDYHEFKELIWEIEIAIQDNGVYTLEIGQSEIQLGRVRLNDGYISFQDFTEQYAKLNERIQELMGVTDIWKVNARNGEIEFLYPSFTGVKHRGWFGSTKLTNAENPLDRYDELEKISDGWYIVWALYGGPKVA